MTLDLNLEGNDQSESDESNKTIFIQSTLVIFYSELCRPGWL
jgi:hypothetical protein